MFRMHDRKVSLELKQLSKQNLNVNKIPLKETRLQQGNTVYSTSGYDWTELSSVKSCYDALTNYGIVNQMLWPYDMTALTLMKLYNVYSWFSYPNIKESNRVQLLCDHFARVSENNLDLAVQKKPPNNYWEMESVEGVAEGGGLPRLAADNEVQHHSGWRPGLPGSKSARRGSGWQSSRTERPRRRVRNPPKETAGFSTQRPDDLL